MNLRPAGMPYMEDVAFPSLHEAEPSTLFSGITEWRPCRSVVFISSSNQDGTSMAD